MDYQPTGQQQDQQMGQSIGQDGSSSNTVWYVIGAVVVVAVLALLYFYEIKDPIATDDQAPVAEQQEQAAAPALTSGNTTSDISADINQTPDTSSELEAETAASAAVIQGL